MTDAERCVQAHERHLQKTQGPASAKRANYVPFDRRFLRHRFDSGPVTLSSMDADLGEQMDSVDLDAALPPDDEALSRGIQPQPASRHENMGYPAVALALGNRMRSSGLPCGRPVHCEGQPKECSHVH